MKPATRFLTSSKITLAVYIFSFFLLCLSLSPSQPPSGFARKALSSLLDPATGDDALERSCKRISAALATYVDAHKPENWNDQAVPDSLDDLTKLESQIDKLDNAENIDAFMRYTLEYLIRHPQSKTFAQRLWKLSAITELTERESSALLLKKPFLPALLNACALLPPDNPFNLEGKFLAARHYRHLEKANQEEALFRDLLQRPRLSQEAKFTVNKLLGNFLESEGRHEEAIDLYIETSKELEGLPQSVDMKLRGALLHLENGSRDIALAIIRELASTPPALLKLTSAPVVTKNLIKLSTEGTSITDHWKHSENWWKQWRALRTTLGHKRPDNEKRIPNLNEISNFEQKIASAVAARNDEQFHSLLDLLMHALRWCPSLIDQAGPSLCFFATRIHPDHQRQIYDFTIELCQDFGPEGSNERRSAILYQTICYSDTDKHDSAVNLIEAFRKSDTRNDALSETMIRLWAHLAIAGHTEIDGPRAALEKILDASTQAFNRPQCVLYLARIYRFLELVENEKSLLQKELKHADIRDDNAMATILSNRYREITQDKAVNADLAVAAKQWSAKHAPAWLEFALPKGLNDDRIKNSRLTQALSDPASISLSHEESVKLQLIAAEDPATQLGIRSRAFYAAFAVIYSGSPTHSAARKMLRDILRDARFPAQLQEIILAYSLEESLSRQRKRDIASAITHPIFNQGNDSIKATRESYANFATVDLQSRESLRNCYKSLTAKTVDQASLTVITALFERLLRVGEIDEAKALVNDMAIWKMDPKLSVGRNALQSAFQKNLERAGKNIPFARSMRSFIRDSFKLPESGSIMPAADYRREVDLKRLPEKEAFSLLMLRATDDHLLETDPQFWMDLAELMPRGENQVAFSFRLVEELLTNDISDLEKSYALFSAPSIIDTDNPQLLNRLLALFVKHQDIAGQPHSYAAMKIVETQSKDLRQGTFVNLDNAWKRLEHPALNRILKSNQIRQLMARRKHDALLMQLQTMPDDELFSPDFVDISWPALQMAGMDEKAVLAGAAVKDLLPSLIAGAARRLDFHSIRLVYAAAKRLKLPEAIPEDWLECLDDQIRSERDRYSLRIIDSEFREDWQEVLKWSAKAVTEYPTYYNYYRPHGIALHKAGLRKEAVRSLEIYTRYSHDEIHWHDAAKLLQEIKD